LTASTRARTRASTSSPRTFAASRGADGADGLQPHARHEVLLAVAVDHHVGDQRVVGEAQLDVGGRHVLAAGGHQDLLLAVDDLQEAVVGEAPHVAGLEPAVVGEGLARGLGILVVAAEDVGPAGEDLAVLGEAQLDARQRLAHRVEAKRVGAVEVSVGEDSVRP
jgi:hypothetical protein